MNSAHSIRAEKLFINSKEMNPGSGVYKIGFIEDRKIIGPDGQASDSTNLIDITREVPDQGQYSIPAYNIIETANDDPPGEYKVIITARDKYSGFKISKEIKYKLI